MTRRAFTRTTKLAAFTRCVNGQGEPICDGCRKVIFAGDGPEYDHIIADEHGGGNGLENCQVLCTACHKPKTRADMKVTVRGRKARARHAGADKPARPMPGSRGSEWYKPLNGPARRREEG